MVDWFDPAQTQGITPYEDLGVLSKVGLILQNVADPNTLPQYNQAVNQSQNQRLILQQRQDQLNQQSALKQLASNPDFARLNPATQLQQVAAITGDPSALAQFNASQQITPYQQAQLGLAQQELGVKQASKEQREKVLQQLFGGSGENATPENLMKVGALLGDTQLSGLGMQLQQQGATQRQQQDQQVTTYAKEVEPLAAVVPSLNQANTLLGKYQGQDIPGVGATGYVGTRFLSPEGREVRQTVQTVGNQILAALSGKAVSDGEAKRMANSIGFDITGEGSLKYTGNVTDDQLRKGLTDVTSQLNSKIDNSSTILSPTALQIYKDRGGTVYPGSLGSMSIDPITAELNRRKESK